MSRKNRISAPLIGITPGLSALPLNRPQTKRESSVILQERYCAAIANAGGVPVILSVTYWRSAIHGLLDRLDGLLVSGGNFDIHPGYYGEKPLRALGEIQPRRTSFELAIIRLALEKDWPVLGICGGAQAINVALGGSLYQDIATQLPNAGNHQQASKKTTGGHSIRIRCGTLLHRILRRENLEVNTTHHQAIKRLGKGLVINATAEDGLIEGIESPGHSFVLGVQWHPEAMLRKLAAQQRIVRSFIVSCGQLHRGTSRKT